MKISSRQFYWYDGASITGLSLTNAAKGLEFEGGTQLSGIQDLFEYLAIIEEGMSAYPLTEFKELASDKDLAVDEVWHEPGDLRKSFSRSLKIHCRIQQDKVTQKRGGEGNQKERPTQVWIGIPDLLTHDYYPQPGDEFEFRGVSYQIILSTTDPEDYFHVSGVPLYVRCEAEVKQQSSLPSRYVPEVLEEPEKPSLVDPSKISVQDQSSGGPAEFFLTQ